MECQYQLMRFGIMQCVLPVNNSGSFKEQKEYLAHIEEQKRLEQHKQQTISDPVVMRLPTRLCSAPPTTTTTMSMTFSKDIGFHSLDILLGKGRRFRHHPGNAKLSEIVEQKQSDCQTASKFEKMCITMSILETMKESQS